VTTEECIKKYAGLIKALFPTGKIWETIFETSEELFRGMAVEFCRVDDRSKELLVELDPLTADELLGDWEALLGLPDECTPEGQSIDERRQQARGKLSSQGGQSANFYEEVAASLGFPDTIVRDFHAFRVGISTVTHPLTNPFENYFRVGENRVGDVLENIGWTFFYEVNAPATINDPFEVGIDTVGEPLVVFGNPLLQCTMKKLKPAHAMPFFTYTT